jgi:hypothetical protein
LHISLFQKLKSEKSGVVCVSKNRREHQYEFLFGTVFIGYAPGSGLNHPRLQRKQQRTVELETADWRREVWIDLLSITIGWGKQSFVFSYSNTIVK